MARTLTFAALSALLLAGCAGVGHDQGPRPSDASTAPPDVAVFTNCLGWVFVGEVPKAWVQERLPEGYVPISSVRSVQGIPVGIPLATSPIGLDATVCEGVKLPDGTQYQDVPMARTKVALEEANGYELEDAYNSYVFEVFFDVAAAPGLASWFTSFGWPVQNASIEVGTESFTVASTDGVRYAFTLGTNLFPYATNEVGRYNDTDRVHSAIDRPSYGIVGDKVFLGSTLFSATLEAEGGFFGTLGPAEQSVGPFAGIGQSQGFEGPAQLQWADDP